MFICLSYVNGDLSILVAMTTSEKCVWIKSCLEHCIIQIKFVLKYVLLIQSKEKQGRVASIFRFWVIFKFQFSGAPEITPGFQWGLCCSIFCFLCSVLVQFLAMVASTIHKFCDQVSFDSLQQVNDIWYVVALSSVHLLFMQVLSPHPLSHSPVTLKLIHSFKL